MSPLFFYLSLLKIPLVLLLSVNKICEYLRFVLVDQPPERVLMNTQYFFHNIENTTI